MTLVTALATTTGRRHCQIAAPVTTSSSGSPKKVLYSAGPETSRSASREPPIDSGEYET